ncbi:hypothetical protein SUGI_0827130 [Cryptomeria japonica]|uniref:protein NEOXANTHIN-DEFICIENT 1 isoform X2 n=1 Tax=Cryptomeria japonica TaxID=3369 RepID=UPI002414A785|nr:protein NEOXANTHIN-DEFICIENT 1 isoform X2 [Cryptomeria japonica]GLJ40263.1 hypothetical protein SUGI_0827130 [Cryptomeria japonica]
MDTCEESQQTKAASNYGSGAPWMFRGRAFYQMHLVKADVVRECIPKGLKLVQAFGYTLGGIYLAQYDDSPAGKFDELVVIAGTVWNWPTSCAWAARVLVNNKEARDHGRKEIGLPSHFASFLKANIADKQQQEQQLFPEQWSRQKSQSEKRNKYKGRLEITVSESNGLKIKTSMESNRDDRWMRPIMRFPLPSFSGCTKFQPDLLKYSCTIDCRVRFVNTAIISACNPNLSKNDYRISGTGYGTELEIKQKEESAERAAQKLTISVLSSRPIIAFAFDDMKMLVRAPVNGNK